MTYDIIQTSAADTLPPFDASTFWTQFSHGIVNVRGVRLHVLTIAAGFCVAAKVKADWPLRLGAQR